MRTFIIFPKNGAEPIEASTKTIALKRYLRKHPDVKPNELFIASDGCVGIFESETIEIPEQGVVITETPKPTEIMEAMANLKEDWDSIDKPKACDPEDSKPEHKEA